MGLFGEQEPQQVEVLGKPLRCHVCGGQEFWQRQAQLNTSLATFFNLDWANPSATCAVCAHCGYIHWFAPLKIQKE
ncbi:MAG: DNA-binding protein [Chloroflexi bacterium]|nr:DNA-binding protein [Chloroflexota bacterium]